MTKISDWIRGQGTARQAYDSLRNDVRYQGAGKTLRERMRSKMDNREDRSYNALMDRFRLRREKKAPGAPPPKAAPPPAKPKKQDSPCGHQDAHYQEGEVTEGETLIRVRT